MSNSNHRPRIIVTGVGSSLGRRLIRRLHRHATIIGIDRHTVRGLPKDVEFHRIDLRRRRAENIFRTTPADAVVHLGVVHDPRATQEDLHAQNVVATGKLIDYCSRFSIPKVILLSTTNVYGPAPDNNQLLDEHSPLMGANDFGELRSLIEMDMLGTNAFWRHPTVETVILRPVHTLGALHNVESSYLRLQRPITLLGFDPMIQVIHIEDVVTAIERSLKPGIKGIFNIVGPGEVPLSILHKMLNRKPIRLPSSLVYRVARTMWRFKIGNFPPRALDHLRFICMADGRHAKEVLGFETSYDINATIQAVRSAPV